MSWKNRPDSAQSAHSFNLRRYFTLFSIVTVIVLTVILSTLFTIRQRGLLVEQVSSLIKTIAHQINHDLLDDYTFKIVKKGDYFTIDRKNMKFYQLDKKIGSFMNDYEEIIKIKIFDRNGMTIYSTDPDNIGVINNSSRFIQALGNNLSSEITRSMQPLKSDTTEIGKRYKIDLLEVYVPIIKTVDHDFGHKQHGDNKEIIGVFEIYYNMSPLFRVVQEESIKISFILMLTMSVFFLILQITIRRAALFIKKQNDQIDRYNTELEEAQDKITESMNEVIEHGSFHIRYSSNSLLRCWEFKHCKETECPSYKSVNLRCWQVSGTFCGGQVQGYFAKKYGDCRKCDVYKYAFKNKMNMIGENFNNMMALLENKHAQTKHLNEKLKEIANIDHLMQMGNRRYFNTRIEAIHQLALRYKRCYSIIICDVDDFKLYNDNHGHQKGDDVLVSVSDLLKESLRKTDEIFRWGGEEIIIILPEQNMTDALKIAEHLRHAVEDLAIEHDKSDREVLTISCGVATFIPGVTRDSGWEDIVKEADDALYKAKSGNKNCVFAASTDEGPYTFS